MTGNLAESSNNCTQRKKKSPGWWNLSSYHTNHYLSSPSLQFKGASIFWRGNQGRGRKAVQINSDKGLFSAAFIYDGMLLCRDQSKGFIRPTDTSLIVRESSPLMKCCTCQRRFLTQMTFPWKPVEMRESPNGHTQLSLKKQRHKLVHACSHGLWMTCKACFICGREHEFLRK